MAIPFIMEWGITFTDVSLLTGYQLCAVGAVGVVVSACARKFGKRPTLLWSISCAFAGTVWGGCAKTYGSLVGARVLQGLGIAMFESVTYAIIGDLYHVHQRGTRMTYYILAQSGLAQFPTVIAGKITTDLGWRWVFYLLSIFMGLGWALSIFFGWETVYNRSAMYNLDTGSRSVRYSRLPKCGICINIHIQKVNKAMEPNSQATAQEVEDVEEKPTLETVVAATTNGGRIRETYFQRIKPFHGVFTEDALWKMIVGPFYVLLNPTVLWACVIIAFTQVWVIVISFCIAQAFSVPPFLLNTAQQGYVSAGPLVGGLLGCIACGLICDPLARYLTRKNNGIYEPEFRLPMMIFVPLVSTIGYFLFGNLIQQGQSPVGASVMFGLVFVSVQFCAVSTGAYIVDAFRDISVEIFVISMTFKNFIFFAFTCK